MVPALVLALALLSALAALVDERLSCGRGVAEIFVLLQAMLGKIGSCGAREAACADGLWCRVAPSVCTTAVAELARCCVEEVMWFWALRSVDFARRFVVADDRGRCCESCAVAGR